MAKGDMTAIEFLRMLERRAFPDIDLGVLYELLPEEREAMLIQHVERLLGAAPHGDWAWWLAGQFWTSNPEHTLSFEPHPFMEDPLQIRMQEDMQVNDKDYMKIVWILHTALFCHHLFTHQPFNVDILHTGMHVRPFEVQFRSDGSYDTDAIFRAFYADFEYGNQPLIHWIRTTKYRRLAAMVTRIMIDIEANKAVEGNPVVEDYYVTTCFQHMVDPSDEADCEEHIDAWLQAMEVMHQHRQQGHRHGLTDEQIRVTNALMLHVPHDYPAPVVACAQAFCDKAEALMPHRPYIKSDLGFQKYLHSLLPVLQQIADRHHLSVPADDDSAPATAFVTSWLFDRYHRA